MNEHSHGKLHLTDALVAGDTFAMLRDVCADKWKRESLGFSRRLFLNQFMTIHSLDKHILYI